MRAAIVLVMALGLAGQAWAGEVCGSDCFDDLDCLAGEFCDVDGFCSPKEGDPDCEDQRPEIQTCDADVDCDAGQVCEMGVCQNAPCTRDDDCAAGELCEGGTCEAPACLSDADCDGGICAVGGVCRADEGGGGCSTTGGAGQWPAGLIALAILVLARQYRRRFR